MFYSQCNDCNERWELGTGSTCICPEQEPVAWEQFYPDMGKPKLAYLSPTEPPDKVCYTPPQRTWVGLADEDLEAEFGFIDELLRDTCYRTEAKLKEKNT